MYNLLTDCNIFDIVSTYVTALCIYDNKLNVVNYVVCKNFENTIFFCRNLLK